MENKNYLTRSEYETYIKIKNEIKDLNYIQLDLIRMIVNCEMILKEIKN